jgi:hypothetical protein
MRRLTLVLTVLAAAALVCAPALYGKPDNGNGASGGAGNPHAPGTTGNPHAPGTSGNPHQSGPPGNPGHPTGNDKSTSSTTDGGSLSSATASSSSPASVARAAATPPGQTKAKAGKTTICHHTGSATNPYVLITVSDHALPAHAKHGDLLPGPSGTCADATQPVTVPAASGSGSGGGSGQAVGGAQSSSDAGAGSGVASSLGSPAADDASDPDGGLPFTGEDVWLLVAIGLAACGAGLALHRAHRATSS